MVVEVEVKEIRRVHALYVSTRENLSKNRQGTYDLVGVSIQIVDAVLSVDFGKFNQLDEGKVQDAIIAVTYYSAADKSVVTEFVHYLVLSTSKDPVA